MTALGTVINSSTSVVGLMVTSTSDFLQLFCTPPLVIFVGIGVAGTAFVFVRKVLRR